MAGEEHAPLPLQRPRGAPSAVQGRAELRNEGRPPRVALGGADIVHAGDELLPLLRLPDGQKAVESATLGQPDDGISASTSKLRGCVAPT